MQFGYSVWIFGILFVVALLIVLGGIAAIVIGLIVKKRKNDRAPRRTRKARVLDKREDWTYHQQAVAGDITGAHGYETLSYQHFYVRFAIADGEPEEWETDQKTYDLVREGDTGMLTVQGTRFLSWQAEAPHPA